MTVSSSSDLFAHSDSPLVICTWLRAKMGALVMSTRQCDIDTEEWMIPPVDI